MKQLHILILLLCSASLFAQQRVSSRQTTIDKTLSLAFPASLVASAELLEAMHPLNDKVLYMGVLTTSLTKLPFAISKYPNLEKQTKQAAFAQALRSAADGLVPGSYKVVEATVYEQKGRTLYYKRSRVVFAGGKTVDNNMFYLMRSDGEPLYELKLSSDPNQAEACRQVLEKIALNAIFL